jgi:y4mF family transcriptional regulator
MIVSTAKEFGAAIRARRKERGLTQAALAEFTGFSVSFLSDLENGKETAEIGKALYLANLLGLDVELRKRCEAG